MGSSRRTSGGAGRFLSVVLAATMILGTCRATAAASPSFAGSGCTPIASRPAEGRPLDRQARAGQLQCRVPAGLVLGRAAGFQSPLCPMIEGVEPGYDPLHYMARECHRRQIEIHAWFVNGAYGCPKPRFVLDCHPDWAVDSGNKADPLWYDLGQTEVRRFQSDLMIGALTQYDLDGLHFDYIRYNGPAVCHCKHCQAEFAARYGLQKGEPRAQQWAEYRKSGVTALVATSIASQEQAQRPGHGRRVHAAGFGRKRLSGVARLAPRRDYRLCDPHGLYAQQGRAGQAAPGVKTVDPRLERILPGLAIFKQAKVGEALRPAIWM